MHPTELVIRGRRVVTENWVGPASLHITRGYISSISILDDVPAGAELIDAAPEEIVMHGLVDTHVHVNETARPDWEGYESATQRAAASGCSDNTHVPYN